MISVSQIGNRFFIIWLIETDQAMASKQAVALKDKHKYKLGGKRLKNNLRNTENFYIHNVLFCKLLWF